MPCVDVAINFFATFHKTTMSEHDLGDSDTYSDADETEESDCSAIENDDDTWQVEAPCKAHGPKSMREVIESLERRAKEHEARKSNVHGKWFHKFKEHLAAGDQGGLEHAKQLYAKSRHQLDDQTKQEAKHLWKSAKEGLERRKKPKSKKDTKSTRS
jgi:hypothetical protein